MNSECIAGFYHDFIIKNEHRDGVIEVCSKCRKRKFFHNQTPNYTYLSWHLKQFIQLNSQRYNKEYGTKR